MVHWLGQRTELQPEEAAELLAGELRRQWRDWEEWPENGNHGHLPVRWRVTREAEHAMAGVGWDDIGAESGLLEPHLLAGEYTAVHEAFSERLPHRRLVILGQGGGGKSSLARRLACELLLRWNPGDRVPVVLPLESWEPEKEDLYAWVSRRLNRDHPKLRRLWSSPLGSGEPVPLSRELAESGRLLLVLDGLDELPRASRGTALRKIGQLRTAPVVVTSRTSEYLQAVEDAGLGLPNAAAVELSPVDVPAIKRYLARTTSQFPPGRWNDVFAHLDRGEGSVVAQALQIPLMIWLACTVYQETSSRPAELADPAAFRNATDVEHHLIDSLIAAAFVHAERHSGPATVGRARRWLRFLARWLEKEGTWDLDWWRLHRAATRPADRLATSLPVGLAAGIPTGIITGAMAGQWTGLACGTAMTVLGTLRAYSPAVRPFGDRLPGPVLGRAIALITGLVTGLPAVLHGRLATGVGQGTCAGILAGLAAGFVIHQGRAEPTRVTVDLHSNRRIILRSVGIGVLTGLLFGAALGAALGLVNGPRTGLVFAALSVAMGLALGIVDGLHIWIDAETNLAQSISPRTVRRDDRTAALARALVAGPLVGVGSGLTAAFAYDPAIGTTLGCAMAFAFITTDRMVGITATAWGRFTLVRAWLALRRRLPWHLMSFLDDAHTRGILRRSGTAYQFRHPRLQQRLAARDSAL
ncbi:NACHT domain-containing protein [Streptomyces sp. NPDC051636]|uniref:NACHT domain-containing protein n=1 Tax=Streptomyces sp. NPDC051636 TaxID=3365663 RepID=UPI0037B59547